MSDYKVLIVGAIAAAVAIAGFFLWSADEAVPPAAPGTTTTEPAPPKN